MTFAKLTHTEQSLCRLFNMGNSRTLAPIVRAVNAHEELVHALRQAELQLDRDWGIGKSPISKLIREAIVKAEKGE